MDYECSKYISGQSNVFFSLDIQHSPIMVQIEGNQFLPVEGKGSIHLDSAGEIKINDMYFVPSLAFNLLSIWSITNMGLIVVFDHQ